jgi:predicted porin
VRSFSEKLTSGTDFTRLSWSAVAMMQEMDRPQGLFSEKAGLGHLQFAITREISLLGTGGYDWIHNTVPLSRDLSGPVGTGGIALTLGEDFSLQFEVGQKYNDISYQGSLRWNIGPTAVITGSATDTITTPEGQLLDSLSSLVSTANGGLASSSALYANGTASSLSSFNAQQSGSLSYNQNISRYQRVSLAYSQEFPRDHATVEVFAMRQSVLDRVFVGLPVNNSWGVTGSFGHNLTRLMTATIGAGYSNYEEFGGHSSVYNVNGELTYELSPDTSVYLRTDYLTRDASSTLQSLSPFTGSLDDVRVTIGLSHTL